MTELEQKLRDHLGHQGVPEFIIDEAVKVLEEAYWFGYEKADNEWREATASEGGV